MTEKKTVPVEQQDEALSPTKGEINLGYFLRQRSVAINGGESGG